MDQPHTIGDLLGKGRVPSPAELSDLRALGSFAASMLGRYLEGLTAAQVRSLGARSGEWASHLGGGLGAATALRWAEGLGLSGDLLGDAWSGLWANGAQAGYDAFDGFDFQWVTIEEEDGPAEVPAAAEVPERRRARASLFSRTPAQSRKVAERRPPGSAPRAPKTLRWADGSGVAGETVGALEGAGLFLRDQLTLAETHGAGGSPARAASSAAVEAREVTAGTPRRAALSGNGAATGQQSVWLDGLRVDGRTPALASGLRWAESAFEPGSAHGAGLALTAARAERMAELSPGLANALGRSREPGPRPVYGFYDSVEGEFVSLMDEAVRADAPLPVDGSTRTGSSPRVGRSVTSLFARSPAAATAPPAISLDRVVRRGSDATAVRPYTAGVFANPTRSPAATASASPSLPRGAGSSAVVTSNAAAAGSGVVAPTSSASLALGVDGIGTSAAPAATTPRHALLRSTTSVPQAQPRLAAQVTYRPSGLAQTRAHRSAMGASRSVFLEGGQALAEVSGQVSRLGDHPAGATGPLLAPSSHVPAPPRMDGPAVGRSIAPGAAEAPARSVSTGLASWGLAADGGPDLPLGAALSRAEDFSAFMQLRQHQADAGTGAAGFVPVVGGSGGAQQARRAADWSEPVLDGVVWVAVAGEVDRDPASVLPLATVPRGRRAAQASADAVARAAHASIASRPTLAAATSAQGDVRRTAAPGVTVPALTSRTDLVHAGSRGDFFTVAPALRGGLIHPATVPHVGTGTGQTISARPDMTSSVELHGIGSAFEQAEARRDGSAMGVERLLAAVAPRAGYQARAFDTGFDFVAFESAAVEPGAAPQVGGIRPGAGRRSANDAARRGATLAAGLPDVVEALRAARSAARRPVATARETMTVLPAFGAVTGANGTVGLRGDATMPSLSEGLATRTAAASMVGVVGSSAGGEALTRLAALPVAQRAQVMRTLRQAGWTEPELRVLELGSDGPMGAGALAVGGSLEAAALTPAPGAIRSGLGLKVPSVDKPVSSGLAKNLARMAVGGEAIAGDVGRMGGGASASLGLDLPMMASRSSDGYFGQLAPERLGGRSPEAMTFREAIGELLGLAASGGAASEAMVPAALHDAVLRLARGQRASAVAASPRVTDARAAATPAIGNGPSLAMGQAQALETTGGASWLPGATRTGAGLVAEAASERAAAPSRRVFSERRDDLNWVAPTSERPALEERLAAALAASAGGPAGAARLMGPLRTARVAAAQRVSTTAPSTPQVGSQLVGAPDAPALDRAASGALAAVRPTFGRDVSEPVTLGSVLAPEVMLRGMRRPELEPSQGWAAQGREMPGVLAALSSDGPRSGEAGASEASPSTARRAARVEAATARRAATSTSAAAKGQGGAAASNVATSPIARLLRLIDAHGGRQVLGASMPREELGAFVRQLGALSIDKVTNDRAMGDFAMAWVKRIDGARTGLDFGLSDARSELLQFFSRTERGAEGRLSSESPIHEASLVAPSLATARPTASGADGGVGVGASRPDRSRLRRVAAQVQTSAAGASRPQHGASAAMRDVSWSFVNTGSTASTGRARLGDLGAAAVGASESARVPMPLVAPAIKAVAQTALLSSRSEASPAERMSSSSASSSSSSATPPAEAAEAPTLGKEALEALAVEMADRIARRMKREKERTGWA